MASFPPPQSFFADQKTMWEYVILPEDFLTTTTFLFLLWACAICLCSRATALLSRWRHDLVEAALRTGVGSDLSAAAWEDGSPEEFAERLHLLAMVWRDLDWRPERGG